MIGLPIIYNLFVIEFLIQQIMDSKILMIMIKHLRVINILMINHLKKLPLRKLCKIKIIIILFKE